MRRAPSEARHRHDRASLLWTANHLITAPKSACSCAQIACFRPEQESGIPGLKPLYLRGFQRGVPESPLAGACFWTGFRENSLLTANSPPIRASRDRAPRRPADTAKGRFERLTGSGYAPKKAPVTATCAVARQPETSFESGWRTVRDSNPRDGFPPTHFPGVRLRPLGHLSVARVFSLSCAAITRP